MLDLNTKKKQNRLYVTFRENVEEEELYKYCIEKGKIGGVSAYFKRLAYEDMKRELKEGNK